MDRKERKHLFDDPRNVKALIYGLYVVCAVLLVLDLFVHRYVDHPWEALFGFYSFYGFICCCFLVIAAKGMRKLVRRKEDYYDDD